MAHFGGFLGTLYAGLDMWMGQLGLRLPWTLKHKADNTTLKRKSDARKIDYPKPDGILTFGLGLPRCSCPTPIMRKTSPFTSRSRTLRYPLTSIWRSTTARSSVTVQRAFTSLSKSRTESRACKSTPRTASTAKRATSRTRSRTSIGSLPRVVEAQIIRTCKSLLLTVSVGALVSPSPAFALSSGARTYVEARAAAIEGNHLRSAELFSQLAGSGSADQAIAKEALSQAISAGDMKLALRLARGLPAANTPIEGRMLLVADALRSNDASRAVSVLQGGSDAGDISFLGPFVQAWAAADGRIYPGRSPARCNPEEAICWRPLSRSIGR